MTAQRDRAATVADLLAQGLQKHNAKQPAEAEALYREILRIEPLNADALHLLGLLAWQKGDFDAAIVQIDAAIAIEPGSAVYFNNLGKCYLSRLERPAAELCFRRALEIEPGYPDAGNNLGWLYMEQRRFDLAQALFEQVTARTPGHETAWINLGRLHFEARRFDEARAAFERAIALRPRSGMALLGKLGCLYEKHQIDEALALADLIPGLDPSEASKAYAKKGEILLGLGRIDDARAAFDAGLALDPTNIELLYSRSQGIKTEPTDLFLDDLPRAAEKAAHLDSTPKAQLSYALGKINADLGDMESAARHYAAGASAMLQVSQITEEGAKRFCSLMMEGCKRPFLDELRKSGNPSRQPIFVLGMFRSGTTLTEQILASHPDVFGAGELWCMAGALERLQLPNGVITHDANALNLTEQTPFSERAALYLEMASQVPGFGRPRFTDKMPNNFMFLGLIWAMFPNAKIIHTRRDPVDTCISNYTTLLSSNAYWSYDFGLLGRHYRRYHALMEHWRRELQGQFLELRYEQTVADTEGAARRLLDWCELEWDDRVLDFHKTERVVRTASVTQVRRPIYGTSIGRWKKWEPYIAPLLAEIGDLEDAYQREAE